MANEPIKKANDGTYYFRAHLGYDIMGKRIQKYLSGFRTKRDAREKYHEVLSAKNDYLEVKKESIKYQQYIESIFLQWYKTQVKKQTYENRYPLIELHFPHFYKLPVDLIEPIHVQKWQLKLLRTLKPSYVRIIQGLFSLSMDRAIILGLAKHNPSKIVGNAKDQKAKINFWTKDEFEKVISVIDQNDYYQFFNYVCLWLLFMTGMRIGEATALQWEDLDFETGTLNIDKTLLYKNQQDYKFGEPKTKASNRRIALDRDTLNVLTEWKDAQQNMLGNESYILSYNGIPTQKHTLSHVIERYSKLAGVHKIRIHDLRHSHASLLIDLGENALIVRDRLGHEKIETTLGTYGHLYPNTNYEVANKLGGIINTRSDVEKINVTNNQFTAQFSSNVQ